MAKIKKLPIPKTKREVSIAYISQAEKEMSDEIEKKEFVCKREGSLIRPHLEIELSRKDRPIVN